MLPPSARELWPFFVRAEPRRRRRIARRRRRRHDRTLIICLQSELLTFISYLLARARFLSRDTGVRIPASTRVNWIEDPVSQFS